MSQSKRTDRKTAKGKCDEHVGWRNRLRRFCDCSYYRRLGRVLAGGSPRGLGKESSETQATLIYIFDATCPFMARSPAQAHYAGLSSIKWA